jgi:hypothetical protein
VRGSPNAIRLRYCLRGNAGDRLTAELEIAGALHCGDVSMAAETLDVGRATLHRWIRERPRLRKAIKLGRQAKERHEAEFAEAVGRR